MTNVWLCDECISSRFKHWADAALHIQQTHGVPLFDQIERYATKTIEQYCSREVEHASR